LCEHDQKVASRDLQRSKEFPELGVENAGNDFTEQCDPIPTGSFASLLVSPMRPNPDIPHTGSGFLLSILDVVVRQYTHERVRRIRATHR
jgi:hypothetical protein